jgi:hypothetical protein
MFLLVSKNFCCLQESFPVWMHIWVVRYVHCVLFRSLGINRRGRRIKDTHNNTQNSVVEKHIKNNIFKDLIQWLKAHFMKPFFVGFCFDDQSSDFILWNIEKETWPHLENIKKNNFSNNHDFQLNEFLIAMKWY